MSTTVKVLIVLNFVMVLAFMFIQMTLYATGENWKRRWNEDTKTLADEMKASARIIANESFAHVRADNRIATLNTEVNDYQNQIKKQEDDLSQKEKDYQSLNLTHSQDVTEIEHLRLENKSLSTSLELTRQSNSEQAKIAAVARAAANVLNVKLSETEDDANKAQTALNEAEEKINALNIEKNKLTAIEAQVRDLHPQVWAEVSAGSGQASGYLNAIVAATGKDPSGHQSLVMLTIGKTDKVEEGQEFIIFRDDKYIAKVRVVRVLPNMATCQVIPDSWNDHHYEIQVNDHAQNRL